VAHKGMLILDCRLRIFNFEIRISKFQLYALVYYCQVFLILVNVT